MRVSLYVDSSQNGILLMLISTQNGILHLWIQHKLGFSLCIQHSMRFSFCWFNTKWDSPYNDSTHNEIFLMLIQRRTPLVIQQKMWFSLIKHKMRFSVCRFNTQWYSSYVDSTQNEILLMLIHHKIKLFFCWFNTEWDSLLLIQYRIRFPFCWVITDSTHAESTQNEILLLLSRHRIRIPFRRANGINDQNFYYLCPRILQSLKKDFWLLNTIEIKFSFLLTFNNAVKAKTLNSTKRFF